MDYGETLNKIHSLNKFGSRPGLERILMLLEMMGNPQDSLKFVHVAGTNGKGSVCQMVSSVLRAANYKTGLFISPYITDFRERIQIDNEPITKEDLCRVVDYVFSLMEKLNSRDIIITEFEFVMAVSFEFYKRQNVDIVVCETGLGGLLDCTNVIKPPVCAVLTRIGLDHTDILGETVEAIATQKCGIIKTGSVVVSDVQPDGATEIIKKICEEKYVDVTFADREKASILKTDLNGTKFKYKGNDYSIKLLGEHQVNNALVALETIEILKNRGFNITEENVKKGLKEAQNPARFEVMSEDPLVILDGAHNADGMSTFSRGVKALCKEKPILIMGMLGDKDSKSSLEHIKGMFEYVLTVPINNPRAMTSENMTVLCKNYFENVTTYDSVKTALYDALNLVRDTRRPLCICGSLYLAGEIRPYILESLNK